MFVPGVWELIVEVVVVGILAIPIVKGLGAMSRLAKNDGWDKETVQKKAPHEEEQDDASNRLR